MSERPKVSRKTFLTIAAATLAAGALLAGDRRGPQCAPAAILPGGGFDLKRELGKGSPVLFDHETSGGQLLPGSIRSLALSADGQGLWLGYGNRDPEHQYLPTTISHLDFRNPVSVAAERCQDQSVRISGRVNRIVDAHGYVVAVTDGFDDDPKTNFGIYLRNNSTGKWTQQLQRQGLPEFAHERFYTVIPTEKGFMAGGIGGVLEMPDARQGTDWIERPDLTNTPNGSTAPTHELYQNEKYTVVGKREDKDGLGVAHRDNSRTPDFFSSKANTPSMPDSSIRMLLPVTSDRLLVGNNKGASWLKLGPESISVELAKGLPYENDPEVKDKWILGGATHAEKIYLAAAYGSVEYSGNQSKVIDSRRANAVAIVPEGVLSNRAVAVFGLEVVGQSKGGLLFVPVGS